MRKEEIEYITIGKDWFLRLDEIAQSVENHGEVDMQVLSMLLGYISSASFIVENFKHPIIINPK